MPSGPEIPTPTSATWIILTSLAPSPGNNWRRCCLLLTEAEMTNGKKTKQNQGNKGGGEGKGMGCLALKLPLYRTTTSELSPACLLI